MKLTILHLETSYDRNRSFGHNPFDTLQGTTSRELYSVTYSGQ